MKPIASTPSYEFWLGVREELPILLGVIPFGMIYGILALSAGLSPFDAQAMSSVVFAGSAQFMTAKLLSAATPALIVILTGFVINLRHALYSASLAPYTRHLSMRWKALLAYLLTDEAYAVTILHYQREGDITHRHWHFFGSGLALWTCWQLSTAVGIFLGAQIPPAWGLDFALPLTFIALVVPGLKDLPGIVTAAVASVAAILLFGLPFKLGLIVSVFIAIAVGLWSEKR
jgi:4-azaleucine resistance transporter AzlC